jgi:hypothetical protein
MSMGLTAAPPRSRAERFRRGLPIDNRSCTRGRMFFMPLPFDPGDRNSTAFKNKGNPVLEFRFHGVRDGIGISIR